MKNTFFKQKSWNGYFFLFLNHKLFHMISKYTTLLSPITKTESFHLCAISLDPGHEEVEKRYEESQQGHQGYHAWLLYIVLYKYSVYYERSLCLYFSREWERHLSSVSAKSGSGSN